MTSPTPVTDPVRIVGYGGFRLDAIDRLNRVLASAFRVETGDNKDRWRVFPGKMAEQAAGFIDAAGNYEMIYEHDTMRNGDTAKRPVQPPAALVNTEEGARWWLEFLAQLYLVSDLTRQSESGKQK